MSAAATRRAPTASDPPPAWPATVGRAALAVGMTLLVAVVMAFLLLPIVALFTYQPLGELYPRVRDQGRD